MKVVKKKNYLKLSDIDCCFYDFDLIDDDKTLTIHYDNDANLHMILKSEDNKFSISRDDDAIFVVFDNLYKSIIDGKPLGNYTPTNDYKTLANQLGIIDRKKRIIWKSDDSSKNSLIINKSEDTYELQFVGDNNTIDVVFSGYSSLKYPFNSPFIVLYQQLQNINSIYEESTIINYQKKLKHIS